MAELATGLYTPFTSQGDILQTGTTQLTELARSYEQLGSSSVLDIFFPVRNVPEYRVNIERKKFGVGLSQLVDPVSRSSFLPKAKFERLSVEPLTIKEAGTISQYDINTARRVGTLNETAGLLNIVELVQMLVMRRNNLWNLLKSQVLLGTINYSDPSRGVTKVISSGIPSGNFRDIVTNYGASGAWSQLDTARVISQLLFEYTRLLESGKAQPSHIIMHPRLVTILTMNQEIRELGSREYHTQMGLVSYENGRLAGLAGLRIVEQQGIYEDPADNTVKSIWPINQVVIICKTSFDSSAIAPTVGRMHYTLSEAPDGLPGMYIRVSPPNQIPEPQGISIELGDSGLPFLVYPEWVAVLTVDTAAALNAIIPSAVANNVAVLGPNSK